MCWVGVRVCVECRGEGVLGVRVGVSVGVRVCWV